eukprot:364829-Chlamydomonas_euryale.AAC.9
MPKHGRALSEHAVRPSARMENVLGRRAGRHCVQQWHAMANAMSASTSRGKHLQALACLMLNSRPERGVRPLLDLIRSWGGSPREETHSAHIRAWLKPRWPILLGAAIQRKAKSFTPSMLVQGMLRDAGPNRAAHLHASTKCLTSHRGGSVTVGHQASGVGHAAPTLCRSTHQHSGLCCPINRVGDGMDACKVLKDGHEAGGPLLGPHGRGAPRGIPNCSRVFVQ